MSNLLLILKLMFVTYGQYVLITTCASVVSHVLSHVLFRLVMLLLLLALGCRVVLAMSMEAYLCLVPFVTD